MTGFTVFGTRPKDEIFLPTVPFTIRNDCKVGQWKVGDEDYRDKTIEISIIRVAQYFGSIGKAENTSWTQIWFVPAPSCTKLPRNTVCVTYLKRRSIETFSQKVTELMESGEPARGIFIGSFEKMTGDKGTYYYVTWDWRERTSNEEKEQLKQIERFMSTPHLFLDLSVNLTPTDGMTQAEIESLMQQSKLLPGRTDTPLIRD